LPKKSPAIQDAICERIAQGESLQAICKSDGMPSRQAVLKWLASDPEFVAQYARAREEQADHYADEIVAIADEPPDLITRSTGDGEEDVEVALDGAAIQRQRLRIDARKWVAAKLKPKRYGDKVDVEHGGTVTVEVRKCG
jgi:hypothetical protein